MINSASSGTVELCDLSLQPVVATVQVSNAEGQTLSGFNVRAVNHDLGFCLEGVTDASGTVRFRAMSGTWDIFASPRQEVITKSDGQACYLGQRNVVFRSPAVKVALRPTRVVKVQLGGDAFDFRQGDNYLAFSFDGYGRFFKVSQCGFSKSSDINLFTNLAPEEKGYIAIYSPRGPGETLFFAQRFNGLGQSCYVSVTSKNSCVINPVALGPDRQRTTAHFQLNNNALSFEWSAGTSAYDLSPNSRVRVSPGTYTIIRGVSIGENQGRWLARYPLSLVEAKAGGYEEIRFGGPIRCQSITTIDPAMGFRPMMQLCLNLRDSFGNPICAVTHGGSAIGVFTTTFSGGGKTINAEDHGNFSAFARASIDRRSNPTYEVKLNCGPWGSDVFRGSFFGRDEMNNLDITETKSFVSQSPRTEPELNQVYYRNYDLFHSYMIRGLGVPLDYKGALPESIGGVLGEGPHLCKLDSFAWGELTANGLCPFGLWDFTAHEWGHGLQQCGPANFLTKIDPVNEAYSTLLGAMGLSEIVKDTSFIKYSLGKHPLLLDRIHGLAVDTARPNLIELMQGITAGIAGYEIAKNGRPVAHQRMILEWSNAFVSLREALSRAGQSEIEQFATLYSWMSECDYSDLFNKAGYEVRRTAISAGRSLIEAQIKGAQEPRLSIGFNQVALRTTSIPINVVVPPSKSIGYVKFTLEYDATKLNLTNVYRRDLTQRFGWKLQADTTQPGKAVITIEGMKMENQIGSLCQVNFELKPTASGALPLTLKEAMISEGQSSAIKKPNKIAGYLVVPTPIFLVSPDLPAAVVNRDYSVCLQANGENLTYAVENDSLPEGFTLDSKTGVLTGKPSRAGRNTFWVKVMNKSGRSTLQVFQIKVYDSSEQIPARHLYD